MVKNVNRCELEEMYRGYYEQLKHAVEKYCELFAAVIKRNRRQFQDIHCDSVFYKM